MSVKLRAFIWLLLFIMYNVHSPFTYVKCLIVPIFVLIFLSNVPFSGLTFYDGVIEEYIPVSGTLGGV